MRQVLLIFVGLLIFPMLAGAQMTLDNFDTYDSAAVSLYEGERAEQWFDISIVEDNKHEGTGAMRVVWQNQCETEWGGWINITHTADSVSKVFDFSLYTEFSIWYYVEKPSSVANEVDFRVMLNDLGSANELAESGETWISQNYILDAEPGWNNLVIPLRQDDENVTPTDGFGNPNWGGSVANDGDLNLDRIESWQIEWSQRANLWTGAYRQDQDLVDGIILFDQAQLQGFAPVELVFFNGKAVPAVVNMHTGWSGSVELTDQEDADPSGVTGAVKLNMGVPWDGVDFDLAKPRNMVMNWSTDSLQFKIKADAGLGDLQLIFRHKDSDDLETMESDHPFPATYVLTEASMGYDGTWKQVKVALADFNRFAGTWSNGLNASVPGEMDSTRVEKLQITNNGQDVTGAVVYLDDIWTGNPEFDFIPPAAPAGVSASTGEYYNLVFWQEVESDAAYSVYGSTSPITDVTAAGVEIIVKDKLGSLGLTATHWLQYPLESKNLTYYYAVVCKDAAGNVGEAGFSESVDNLGEAVPSIHFMPGFTFKADGDLSEWDGANIMPWMLDCSLADNTGNTQPNVAAGSFDADGADLTAEAYMAIDADYLYVAAYVTDNSHVYSASSVGSWWTQDALELFMGMWDQNGKNIHTKGPAASRGAEPDYKLIFLEDGYHNEYKSWAAPYTPEIAPDVTGNGSYFYEVIGSDYILEAKIALDSIAFGDDARLHPANGMRVMFDLVFHDNDEGQGGGNNLTWSSKNRDTAHLHQGEWTNTWIGDTTHVDATTSVSNNSTNVVSTYELRQNYPNPFNPETTIEFAIAKPGNVEIAVYNLLGQNVLTLVNQKMNAGQHQVQFDASALSSGVYFYAIKSNEFFKTRKMILLK